MPFVGCKGPNLSVTCSNWDTLAYKISPIGNLWNLINNESELNCVQSVNKKIDHVFINTWLSVPHLNS